MSEGHEGHGLHNCIILFSSRSSIACSVFFVASNVGTTSLDARKRNASLLAGCNPDPERIFERSRISFFVRVAMTWEVHVGQACVV